MENLTTEDLKAMALSYAEEALNLARLAENADPADLPRFQAKITAITGAGNIYATLATHK